MPLSLPMIDKHTEELIRTVWSRKNSLTPDLWYCTTPTIPSCRFRTFFYDQYYLLVFPLTHPLLPTYFSIHPPPIRPLSSPQVCRMWALFGKYAAQHNYHPFNNFDCSEFSQKDAIPHINVGPQGEYDKKWASAKLLNFGAGE